MKSSDTSKVIDSLHCRNTKIRFGIVSIFHHTKRPISAAEIINQLKEMYGTNANKTTVYRQLDFLAQKNIVTSLDIEGISHYQLNKNQPHQVLVCSNCHDIIPLDNEISLSSEQILQLKSKHNFKINYYSFLCFGSCQNCQK